MLRQAYRCGSIGLDFGDGSLVDVQLGNLLRVVTSRSQDTQTTDSRLMSKRETKIVAVGMAIRKRKTTRECAAGRVSCIAS